MAHTQGRILDTGDQFPELALTCVDNRGIVLPRDIKGEWTVLLLYRGHF